jgi:hypothetical protein
MSNPFSVTQETLLAFRSETPGIVAETASRSLARRGDVAQHGAEAPRLITSGIEFTMKMLDAAIAAGESALMEDALRWSLDRLPHDGVSTEQVLSRFAMLREVVSERLPAAPAAEIAAAVEWMELRLRQLAAGRIA